MIQKDKSTWMDVSASGKEIVKIITLLMTPLRLFISPNKIFQTLFPEIKRNVQPIIRMSIVSND